MSKQQSPIFIKTESFMKWLLDHTHKFPRYEQARLARQIEITIFALHENLLYAAKTPQTVHYLLIADAELDKLRTYLRLTLEFKYTAPNQYEYAAQQTLEIGKLLGGWLKTK